MAEKTLVFIDEPETHLHPPLLAAYLRSVSDLLSDRNGVGIVATHSPVVLQEVPSECVSIITRAGSRKLAHRPRLETFGENVGILTNDIFHLEVTESGFHKRLEELVLTGLNYESILEKLNQALGTEGRALLRAIIQEEIGA